MSCKLFLIITFISINFCFSQAKKEIINGIEFKMVTSIDKDRQAVFMQLYRGNKKILTHTISEIDGDCSSEIIELGEYEIIDSNFIFYTYWAAGDRMDKNIYPYGFRKQIYSVNKKGFVRLKSSKIYIEAYLDEYNEHKGMKYLKNKPKTDKEFELMKDYTLKAEKMYFGDFVFGKNKLHLENEVRDKIGKRIMKHTKDWKKIFAGNCRM